MLEDLYFGSKPPKEEYMHDFSKEEKAVFRAYIQEKQECLKQAKLILGRLIAEGGKMELYEHNDPRPSTALDIKYALNRIAANDPQALDFHLSQVDKEAIGNPDRLALDIARAFRNNTNCKYITLNGIGLTDNGMIPILHSLPSELYKLDIAGNNITDKSVEALAGALDNPHNKWNEVNLGEVQLTSEQEKALEKHPNLYFENVKSENQAEAPSAAPTNEVKKPTIANMMRRLFQR